MRTLSEGSSLQMTRALNLPEPQYRVKSGLIASSDHYWMKNNFRSSSWLQRISRLLPGAALAAVVSIGWAAPAMASAAPRGELPAQITVGQITPASPVAAIPTTVVKCVPRLHHFNRTQACWASRGTVNIFNADGEKIGSVVFDTIQSIDLHAIGRNFSEYFDVAKVTNSGTVPPVISMFFSAFCGRPCSTTIHFPEGAALQVGTSGTISHHDAIGTGKSHSTRTHYSLAFTAPGNISLGPILWKSPVYYRCDDKIKTQGAGCVLPQYSPTLSTMAVLPHIAKNIRRIQNAGPGHYGRPFSPHPLHRLVNKAQQRKNHDAVCSKRARGAAPKGKSCDEYPFATSYEGGTKLNGANRGWAWVPTAEQDSQGGKINAFYNANRVLNHDAYYVKV